MGFPFQHTGWLKISLYSFLLKFLSQPNSFCTVGGFLCKKKKKKRKLPSSLQRQMRTRNSVPCYLCAESSAATPSTSAPSNYYSEQMHTCGSDRARRNTYTSPSHFKSKASCINTKNCYKSFKNSNSLTCQLCSQHISQSWRQTQELQQLSPAKHFLPGWSSVYLWSMKRPGSQNTRSFSEQPKRQQKFLPRTRSKFAESRCSQGCSSVVCSELVNISSADKVPHDITGSCLLLSLY